MEKIAEMIYQAYESSGNRNIYSEKYEEALKEAYEAIGKENRKKLINLECEILESMVLCSIDVILYMLNLICPNYD